MPDANVIEGIRDKYRDLSAELDERGRRMWAAVEARSLGRGGITAVAAATGISDRTIRNGIRDLASGDFLSSDRQRRSGGSRKTYQDLQPELLNALDVTVHGPGLVCTGK